MSFNKFDRPNFQNTQKPQYPQNRFDKPYISQPFLDQRKVLELFSIFDSTLSTSELQIYCLKNKISMNQSDEDGNNLIHRALMNNELDEGDMVAIIEFLVENDVNPDKANKSNMTPLHIACELQYKDVVEKLLEIGVEPNAQDNMGNTPFHYLLTGKIIEYEPDVNKRELLLNLPVTISAPVPVPAIDQTIITLIKDTSSHIAILITTTTTPPPPSTITDFIHNMITEIVKIINLPNPFILYTIDPTSKMSMNEKNYNELYINDEIVITLLKCGGSPFIKNLHNIAPIHNIINLYNHKLLDTILNNADVKDIGFDLKDDINRITELSKKNLKLASSSLRQLNLFCLDNNIKNDKLSPTDMAMLNDPATATALATTLATTLPQLTPKEEKIKDIFTVIFENIYKAWIIKNRIQETITVMTDYQKSL